MNAGLLVFILLLLLSFLGIPIFISLGIGTLIALNMADLPMLVLPQKLFAGMNSSSLLAIPFFILAGNLMSRSITGKLIDVANALIGRIKGSLALVTVVASGLFGAHEKMPAKEVAKTFKSSIWALLMPIIILGGIFGGIFTATEAAAVAVVYALIVSLFIYKDTKWSELPASFVEASVSTATIMVMVGLSKAMWWSPPACRPCCWTPSPASLRAGC